MIRHPGWLVLVGVAVWLFLVLPAPEFYLGLECPLFEEGTLVIASVGQWGRNLLVILETWGGILFSLLVSFIVTRTLALEHAHRQVLWATHGGSKLLWAKVLAAGSLSTLLIVLGAVPALLTPDKRQGLVLAGIEYLAIYLALAWIRVTVWVALSFLFYSCFRSRLATIPLVGAVQIAWFGTAGFWGAPSLPRLLHRSFLSWNFISVFTPTGIIPRVFWFQALSCLGLVLGLVGGAFWIRGWLPEWRGLRRGAALMTSVLGIFLVGGGAIGITTAIRGQTAPFTAEDLWDGKARLERPYVWSKDFRLLIHPGPYLAARLPEGADMPAWLEELAAVRDVRVYAGVGRMILRGHAGAEARTGAQMLVTAHPPGRGWPPDLDGLMERFNTAISTVTNRAHTLFQLPLPKGIALLWPCDAVPLFLGDDLAAWANGTLHVHYQLLFRPIQEQQWNVVWAITAPILRDETARVYLAMYLMHEIDAQGVELALERLRYVRERAELEFFRKYGVVRTFYSFAKVAHAPGGAEKILQHWQQGEEMGHEAYIAGLLKGRDG